MIYQGYNEFAFTNYRKLRREIKHSFSAIYIASKFTKNCLFQADAREINNKIKIIE